jgi:type IV pilus assembly protein PilF
VLALCGNNSAAIIKKVKKVVAVLIEGFMKVFKLRELGFILVILLLPISCAQKLVNNDIDKSEAAKRYVEAAKAYIEEQNTRKALEHLKKSESFEAKSAELFHTYALLYRIEGDIKRQEYYYKRALREDKKDSRVKNNYGSFLCHHGKAKKGLRLLKDATKDYQYANRADAFINRGACELTLEDSESAEDSFQQSLRLGTQSSRPLLELSDIYFKKNNLDVAGRYYQQFVSKVAQQSARSLLLGAKIAKAQGDENAAASYGFSLQKRFPNSKETQHYLNMAN